MLKRFFDLIVSIFLFFILIPVIVILAVLIKMRIGSPVLFIQERPGLHADIFKLYKFRTMSDKKDSNGELLPDAERLLNFGKFLRKYSLDELPQLWNVIRGDLSLVGPRPLLVEYLPLYTDEQFKRHKVKPGITGWAQINGRNAITWEEKFRLDVWYVENQTFWLDLKILIITLKKVIHSESITQANHVTVEKFLGSQNNKKNGMEKIVLIGNGGHSKVIRDLILDDGSFELYAILDDQFTDIVNREILYGPVSYLKSLVNSCEFKLVIAIGNNITRKRIVAELALPLNQYATLIHPTAIISSSAKLGQGSVVMPNSVINAHTVIGNHVIINSSSVIEHDNTIEDFAHIAPNATLTGSVRVGEGTQISAAASVIPNVNVGCWCMIGAGSTVIQDIPSNVVAVGSPARIIEPKDFKGMYLNDNEEKLYK